MMAGLDSYSIYGDLGRDVLLGLAIFTLNISH